MQLRERPFWNISIHALREVGDFFAVSFSHIFSIFLSTPSARRATVCLISANSEIVSISIHALREEGDATRAG